MNRSVVIASSVSFVVAAALVGQLAADFTFTPLTPPPRLEPISAMPISGGGGADIIVGAVNGVQNWGGSAGLSVSSLGQTKCNIGDEVVTMLMASPNHPVLTSNLHRVSTVNGASRIEQLGQAWVYHTFCALQQSACGPCTPAGSGCVSAIGVGCSDPNTSAGCGTQANLGPRYDINAATAVFTYPLAAITQTLYLADGQPVAIGVKGKRLQIPNADLDPILNPGAEYFGEYVGIAPDDAAAGNGGNGASYRRLTVGALSGTPPNQFYLLQVDASRPTVRELPALHAWQALDPTVAIAPIDVPDDGRFVIGHDVTDLGDGTWHYEYAIVNINSHRSGQAFSVPIPEGVAVTNIGFRDVDYHTQELLAPQFRVDNVEWTATVDNGAITWSTSHYTGPSPVGNDHTANALRWATMYNFRFDADVPPATVRATLALFRPGTPDEMSIELLGPGALPECPADLSGDGIVNGIDLALLLGAWGNCGAPDSCTADLDGSGSVNGLDLATLLAAWGSC